MSTSTDVPWWVTAPPQAPAAPRLKRRRWILAPVLLGIVLLAGVLVAARIPGRPALLAVPSATDAPEVVAEAPSPPLAAPEVVAVPALLPNLDSSLLRTLPPPLPNGPAAANAREQVQAPVVPKPMPAAVSRRDTATEDDLRRQLILAQEVGLGLTGPALIQAYASQAQAATQLVPNGLEVSPSDGQALLEVVPEAVTLPLHLGSRAEIAPGAAATLDVLSRKLRIYLSAAAPRGADGRRPTPTVLARALREEMRGKRPEWLRVEAVPTLLQMLMPEDAPVRRMLVDLLAEIPEKAATVALARRAVFDLDAGVRQAATASLRGRAAAAWRPVLLEAFRYPWGPIADHAAEALVSLDDKEAVPTLVTLLKLPNSAAPRKLANGTRIAREVVRANHLTNCLLCHPPAISGAEPVLGLDPVLTISVPTQSVQSSVAQGLQTTPGSHGYGGPTARAVPTTTRTTNRVSGVVQVPLIVRGDVTFLRQDFSVRLPLFVMAAGPGVVPEVRYDFMVRTRRLTKTEFARLTEQPAPADYPQRDAVLFALRQLTGSDAGPTTEAWRARYPNAERDVEAARLADALVRASPARLGMLLGQVRGVADEVAILALESALPRMRGDLVDGVRTALSDRRARQAAGEKPASDLIALATFEEEADEEKLFTARALTEDDAFTPGIEGPACDAKGNVYAVNFGRQQTIGRVTPDGKGEVFVELPGKSTGNGIVFDPKGIMYVADYVGHNVLRIDPATRKVTVYAHEDKMTQPNDLAIAPDGTLYASDPDWDKGTGRVWRIDAKGKVHLEVGDLGTANGIEVSPDGKTLYVNESKQRNVWAFAIGRDGTLSDKRLLKKFDDHGFDGMRCDVDGNLYITRYGKGTVAVLSPAGKVLREIDVLGPSPSNLCFGGPDGRTVYVTEVSKRRLVQFRTERPGLAWQRWRDK